VRDELHQVGRLLEPVADAPAGQDPEGFAVRATHRRVRDYSADGVRRSLEASLVRLGVNRIDIALVHDPDDFWDAASRQALPALVRMREEGMVGAVGVGMNQAAMLTRFVHETDVDLVMPAGRFTLLDDSALKELLPEALRRGVGVLATGVLTRACWPATNRASTPTSTTEPLPRTWCGEPASSPPYAASTAAPCPRRRCTTCCGTPRW